MSDQVGYDFYIYLLWPVSLLRIFKYGFRQSKMDVILRAGRAFLDSRSCVPGVLGTRASGNAIFFKARGNAERKEVGTLIVRA